MGWELYLAKDSFKIYQNEWDRLNKSLNKSHPMLDGRFIEALVQYFSRSNTFIAIYTEGSEVLNIVLLEKLGAFKWRTFQPSQSQISCMQVTNPKVLEKLFNCLGRFALTMDLYCVDPKYSERVLAISTFQFFYAKTMNILLSDNFEGYWKKRPKKLRNNIRRYFKRSDENFNKIGPG